MIEHSILEFDGPPTAYCFGRTYDTLTSVGLKREGQPYPGEAAPDEATAWAAYEFQLASYKAGAMQIAWRLRPIVEDSGEGFYIRSRLAAYP